MSFMNIPSPCKDCPDRREACHDDCKRYVEYRQKIDQAKEKRLGMLRTNKPRKLS